MRPTFEILQSEVEMERKDLTNYDSDITLESFVVMWTGLTSFE